MNTVPCLLRADRAKKLAARRDALIARCLTSPKATQADRLNVHALAHPLLARISRAA